MSRGPSDTLHYQRALRFARVLLPVLLLAGCAASKTTVPYPAFIQADELPDIFMAGLPGIRAKRFTVNPDTRRSSNLMLLPPDWSFTTGSQPNKSVEIYVFAGTLKLGEFTLSPGGYAYIPDGSVGLPLSTDEGARILYYIDDANPTSVIQTPLITNRNILDWEPASDEVDDIGLSVKVLREDPGSGARTWLLKVDPIATRGWQKRTVAEEGFLLEGSMRHSECVAGNVVTDVYTPGGYYIRPADAVNGGPDSAALQTSVWFVRTLAGGALESVDGCYPPPPGVPEPTSSQTW